MFFQYIPGILPSIIGLGRQAQSVLRPRAGFPSADRKISITVLVITSEWTGIQNAGFGIWNWRPRIQDPGPKIQDLNPGPKTCNPGQKTQNQELRRRLWDLWLKFRFYTVHYLDIPCTNCFFFHMVKLILIFTFLKRKSVFSIRYKFWFNEFKSRLFFS